jgi:basic membrane lipoprotein Med (substrate-binding protein (PBP1-ABC) superfamily)
MWQRGKAIFAAMKKLLFLGACLVALASQPLMAQTGGSNVVVVRVHDSGVNIELVINRGKGQSELIKFNSGVSDKHLQEAAEGYQQALAKLYQEGYSLKSTFTSTERLSTLVFVKDR